MKEERDRRDNRTRYSKNHYEGKRKDVPARRDDVDTYPEEPSFQKLRDNIKAFLPSSLKPQSVADRGRSISRKRKISNFEHSPPVLCDLAKENNVLSSEMRSKNLKPSSKFFVSTSSVESSSSDRTMDDSEVIGTATIVKPAVSSGRDVGMHAGIETGQFFRTLVRSGGNIEHYQVPSLDRWKRSMDIGNDIDIAYYNGTGAEGVMNALKSCLGQLNGNIFEIMRSLNQKLLLIRRRAHQNRAMATSGSAYADSMEIPACDAGTSSSLVRRPRVKRTAPPSEQAALVQTPQVGVERVNTDVNMASPLKKQKQESGKDIRASSKGVDLKAVEQEALDLAKQLSAAWKSAAEVLKVAAADRAEYEDQFEKEPAATKKEVKDEAKKAVDIVVASRNKLIQAFYFWGLSREDVNLALAGKHSEIIFPGDDASQVAEQSPAPPVADDMTKEEVVRLRGKVIELEKALSRARDFLNRTQQAKNDEQDELVVLSASNKELPAKLQQCLLVVENTTLLNSKLESNMLELQSQLNAVTVEFSCKDAEILTANNEAELWKESLKKKKLETMAVNQQVLDLLSTIKKQKNNLLYHQSVVTNNTDLLMKQDAEICHMRERLKKLNWDLREARDSCKRKSDRAKTQEEACSKRDQKLNKTINKYNTRIADLDQEKQALILECMQGNESFEELHVKYKESQMMVDVAENEINYSKEVDKKLQCLKQEMERSMQITKQYRDSLLQEKKSMADRCKDLEDELNKVKAKICEATLLTADNVTLRTMAMLYADVEKFRTVLIELLNAPSTVVDAAIPFLALLSSGPGQSLNVVRPKHEK
ncbi:hypothetical protein GIB67_042348 [Kingdonia uniflora]|uniref:Uncharacterized protein n=1 Tax=Kingdonia uniflora TaxID=39325 RepID=A0A7J7LAW9_9MAGN|nr:hypothetical protein GIB67_042348 [Kingdonia uniflora]